MPLGLKPVCISCKTTTSNLWKKNPQGEILCLSCNNKTGNGGNGTGNGSNNGSNGNGRNNGSSSNQNAVRKSSRIKPSKHRFAGSHKPLSSKGKGRRIIFKKTTRWRRILCPTSRILQDQYNEKSAVITWLLPTQSSPSDRFDPSTYILGPEEDLPRKLEFMEFVCHAPSDYFRAKNAPYPTNNTKPELCYILTSLENSIIKPTPTISEMFGSEETVKKKTAKEKRMEKSL
ncbi:hypothetical protein LOTGIDRAFT_178504 [Lottia gigantea]|uniref:GATA zinc finger domain-containing protein 1 n=1 Tax=Lottia gigantea TaxID=225164 RepID=V3ZQ21_LOTGI|nr:hypothetical protein LOTGIDRAFT_178504 [Lottia gigantea]ESO93483.1 hypothetical protein LOTGIDRAFT_178504 [Lottia gigantea]